MLSTCDKITCRIDIAAPARLLTENAQRRLNHFERNRIVPAWRWAAEITARAGSVPRFACVDVGAQASQSMGRLADAGAHLPIAKAAIDGLVDAGVLPGDGPEHVTSLRFLAPSRSTSDGLTLWLNGTPA